MEERKEFFETVVKEIEEFKELNAAKREIKEALEEKTKKQKKAEYLLERELWMLKNSKAIAAKIVKKIEANINPPDWIKVLRGQQEVLLLLIAEAEGELVADIFAVTEGEVFAAPHIVPFDIIKEIKKTTIVPDGGDGYLKTTGGVIKLKKI